MQNSIVFTAITKDTSYCEIIRPIRASSIDRPNVIYVILIPYIFTAIGAFASLFFVYTSYITFIMYSIGVGFCGPIIASARQMIFNVHFNIFNRGFLAFFWVFLIVFLRSFIGTRFAILAQSIDAGTIFVEMISIGGEFLLTGTASNKSVRRFRVESMRVSRNALYTYTHQAIFGIGRSVKKLWSARFCFTAPSAFYHSIDDMFSFARSRICTAFTSTANAIFTFFRKMEIFSCGRFTYAALIATFYGGIHSVSLSPNHMLMLANGVIDRLSVANLANKTIIPQQAVQL